MEYRPLGRTGIQVSKLCLGTMMFGAWGNSDHDDSIRIIHAALDAGIKFRGYRRRLLRRRVRGDPRQGIKGPSREHRACHEVLHADGRRSQPARRLAPLDHHRGRELPQAARHRLDRPLPGAPTRPRNRRRGNPQRADRPRPAGQGPLHRLLLLLGRRDRRSTVDRARPQPPALPHRAAAVLATRPWHRARRAPNRPAARHGHPHLQPPGRRLAVRPLERASNAHLARQAATRRPLRHDAARKPAQTPGDRGARGRWPTRPAYRSSNLPSPSWSTTLP